MNILQHLTFFKKPSLILAFILAVFFLKGVFLAVLHPIFIGQDEARHYNTIQYISNANSTVQITDNRRHISDKKSIVDYNFSQEIIETGLASDTDRIRDGSLYNTILFSENYQGENEEKINQSKWSKENYFLYPDKATEKAYHFLASLIEKSFSDKTILVRFFLIRIFSVFLGTLAVLFVYLTAKTSGFSSKISLLLTAIVSFQPRFSIYYASINYDALLILAFFIFTLAGTLILKNGLRGKNFALLFFATALGLLSKGTGIILLAMATGLLLFEFYKKTKDKILFALVSILTLIILFFSPYNPLNFLPSGNEANSGIFNSLKEYVLKSLTFGRLEFSAKIYWGYVGWINSWFLENFIYLIWTVELFSLIGLIIFFISKNKPSFLPDKKYIIFFLLMITSLQLGIRAYDWKVYDSLKSLALGTPGRYFLPNLAAHIIIVFTGLGMILKKRVFFENTLIVGFILTFSFCAYIIFNVILPRFYL